VSEPIDAFGGDGAHEVRYRTEQGEQSVYVRRDLWFDRDDSRSWIVWAQHHAWDRDDPPADGDIDAASLGSIVVTHPDVMAFIDQLGELLVDPGRFRHGARFGETSVDAGDRRHTAEEHDPS
jgi:hypothetical protein